MEFDGLPFGITLAGLTQYSAATTLDGFIADAHGSPSFGHLPSRCSGLGRDRAH